MYSHWQRFVNIDSFPLLNEQERVERLYQFRDEYFKTHEISEAAMKAQRVQQEIDDTVKLVTSLRGEWRPGGRNGSCGESHSLWMRMIDGIRQQCSYRDCHE